MLLGYVAKVSAKKAERSFINEAPIFFLMNEKPMQIGPLLRQISNDNRLPESIRCQTVYELFRIAFFPGMTLHELSLIFGLATWVDELSLTVVEVVLGKLPVKPTLFSGVYL